MNSEAINSEAINSEAINKYLQEFYDSPKTIEEYKINLLKQHYFPQANKIMHMDFKNFQIGVYKSKRDLIYFKNKILTTYLIVYNHKTDKYYIQYNNSDLRPIDINLYNKSSYKKKYKFCNLL